LRDLVTGQLTTGRIAARRMNGRRTAEAEPDRCAFTVHLMPHSYCVFAAETGDSPN
jgi:hypothetical protein